jgi:hypothetical protein
MSQLGQKRRFDPQLATSDLPRSTDINRPAQLVRFVPLPEVAELQLARLGLLLGLPFAGELLRLG